MGIDHQMNFFNGYVGWYSVFFLLSTSSVKTNAAMALMLLSGIGHVFFFFCRPATVGNAQMNQTTCLDIKPGANQCLGCHVPFESNLHVVHTQYVLSIVNFLLKIILIKWPASAVIYGLNFRVFFGFVCNNKPSHPHPFTMLDYYVRTVNVCKTKNFII